MTGPDSGMAALVGRDSGTESEMGLVSDWDGTRRSPDTELRFFLFHFNFFPDHTQGAVGNLAPTRSRFQAEGSAEAEYDESRLPSQRLGTGSPRSAA